MPARALTSSLPFIFFFRDAPRSTLVLRTTTTLTTSPQHFVPANFKRHICPNYAESFFFFFSLVYQLIRSAVNSRGRQPVAIGRSWRRGHLNRPPPDRFYIKRWRHQMKRHLPVRDREGRGEYQLSPRPPRVLITTFTQKPRPFMEVGVLK